MAFLDESSEPAAFGISTQTAKALADPWRIQILMAVSSRPMSPSQFVEKIGGDLTHVARCFRQLAQWGSLEIVEERHGRRCGAAIEHVYRVSRRAFLDACTWERALRSDREVGPISVLNSYFTRMEEAIEAGTFEQEVDRHFSWDAVALDHVARAQLGTRLDRVQASLDDLEIEATQRLRGGGEETIPTTVGLAAFRSPGDPLEMVRGSRRHYGPVDATSPASPFGIGPALANALSNKWRSRILMATSIRPISPSEFVQRVGGSMTYISRSFRQLAQLGYLEVLEERKGGRHGGGIERIYRSTLRPYFDTPAWAALPPIVREEVSQHIVDSYLAQVTSAVEAGTIDCEVDRHLSWKPLVVDRPAWTELADELDQILAWLPELEAQSIGRADDLNRLIPTTVGLASFRSPS